MSLALLFHYLMFNMFRMLIHPSSGACDLFVELFHGLYCSVRIEIFVLAYLFSGECLVVTCVVFFRKRVSANIGCCSVLWLFKKHYQKTYYTQRKLNNHKAPQQPIFAETRFLKQPHTSRLNTRH